MIMCAQHQFGEMLVQDMIVWFSMVLMALSLPKYLHFSPFTHPPQIIALLSSTSIVPLVVTHHLIIFSFKIKIGRNLSLWTALSELLIFFHLPSIIHSSLSRTFQVLIFTFACSSNPMCFAPSDSLSFLLVLIFKV